MRSVPTVAAVKLHLVAVSPALTDFLPPVTLPLEPRVQLVITHLHADLKQSPSMCELTALVGLSPRQLERLFRAATGCSLSQYLKQTRLAKAQELLATSTMCLKEIRVEVGMPDAAYFHHAFKATFGVPPKKYQWLVRQQNHLARCA